MTLTNAEQEAMRARAVLSKLEHEAVVARENGTKLSPAWWAYFGDVYSSVKLAEHAVNKAREAAEKAR